MSSIRGMMNQRHGRFRAVYNGADLGELACPPEIRAGYEAESFTVQENFALARTIEAVPELSAVIRLRVKAVQLALELLDKLPGNSGELLLRNPDCRPEMELLFPDCRLLPVWEFTPSFTGSHHILLQFSARCGANGKLFRLSAG